MRAVPPSGKSSVDEIKRLYGADALEQAFLNATGRAFEDEDDDQEGRG